MIVCECTQGPLWIVKFLCILRKQAGVQYLVMTVWPLQEDHQAKTARHEIIAGQESGDILFESILWGMGE